ncbi:Dynamin-like protein C [Hordeum vulgare]|nr:Dynamin-like protein C [Hordeum vulgare]
MVAIGGQSKCKSSLLEALLGFRFNVREVEMGTRRPLVLQMVHDPTALDPRYRFQRLISMGIANILLAHAGRSGSSGMTEAVAEIARAAARSWLAPLTETACDRLAFVLQSLFDLAMEHSRTDDSRCGGRGLEISMLGKKWSFAAGKGRAPGWKEIALSMLYSSLAAIEEVS